jgi:uncharacterized protein
MARSPGRRVFFRFVLTWPFIAGLVSGCERQTTRQVPQPAPVFPPAQPPPKALIAIIIDDVGHNERALSDAIALTIPVTFAVLPGLAKSDQLAEALSRGGFEIMLHQPMEPASKHVDPGPGSIDARMTAEQIQAVLARNIEQVPLARGVNNHMGSKATASPHVVEVILPFLAGRGLFFVDSLTTSASVCREVADRMGISIAVRDVFLDNVLTREYISGQLERLKRLALKNGQAVGVGHFHPLTLRTIEELAPSVEKEGVEFVFVSELIRRMQDSQTGEEDVSANTTEGAAPRVPAEAPRAGSP